MPAAKNFQGIVCCASRGGSSDSPREVPHSDQIERLFVLLDLSSSAARANIEAGKPIAAARALARGQRHARTIQRLLAETENPAPAPFSVVEPPIELDARRPDPGALEVPTFLRRALRRPIDITEIATQ